MPTIPANSLLDRLTDFLYSQDLRGLETRKSQARFVAHLRSARKKLREICMHKFAGSVDPNRTDFHPLKAAIQLWGSGDADEALWLLFLTIHFGQDVPETIRLFYGKLGAGCWHWETVRQRPEMLQNWMRENRTKLRKLKFGNHRKRRIMDSEHKRGTWTVIRSFLDWVAEHGKGSPKRAFDKCVEVTLDPGNTFDRAYEMLDIFDFGRTAKFDLLCLLGNLRIFNLSPSHCYLSGSTGPKQGALLMVTGRRYGKFELEIDQTIRKLTAFLRVPVEVMEDALCNWQKHPKSKQNLEQSGYLSSCS